MKHIWTIVFLLLPLMMMSQTVTNVVAEQVGKKIEIRYQLDKQSDISIQYSTDGGSTYRSMSHTSGDVGRNIASGQHTITWDVLADVEKLVCSNLVFKVTPSGGEKLTFTVKGVSFTMIKVEGGTFTMGATIEQGSDAESDEKPTHSVTLSTYYMGETEVTQELWIAVMGFNPSVFSYKEKMSPVENVSWNECHRFLCRLNDILASQLFDMRFTLPSEAQWEYAARGGNMDQKSKYSGSISLSSVAWYSDNSQGSTQPVKKKQANKLGLYDMSGNVWEWCEDIYRNYSLSPQTNQNSSSNDDCRVYRGGCWNLSASCCRVSNRQSNVPSYHRSNLGLRLCLLP